MTPRERNLDPKYLKALVGSAEHHKDGVNRTIKDYDSFPLTFSACALCGYFGTIDRLNLKCSLCFLDDSREKGAPCAKEIPAITTEFGLFYFTKENPSERWKSFHAMELGLYSRICVELKRVRDLQEKIHPKPYVGEKNHVST